MREFCLKRNNMELSCAAFECGAPSVCLQIIHGCKEHKERYYPFAEYLCRKGCSVYISDLRGHGASVSASCPLGHMNGWKELVDDQAALTCLISKRNPGIPVCLLGHSFGSMLARLYLKENDRKITKLILTGTVPYYPASKPGTALGRLISVYRKDTEYSPLLTAIGDNGFTDWSCENIFIREAFREDPLCSGYKYTLGALKTVMDADLALKEPAKALNHFLSILTANGSNDPVTGGRKGTASVVKQLHACGYTDVRQISYERMSHEVLNETGHDKVWRDFSGFLGL